MAPERKPDDTKLVSAATPDAVVLRMLPKMTAEQLQQVIAAAQQVLRQRGGKGK